MDSVTARRAVFIDASAWYALTDGRDPMHPAATRRFRRLAELRRTPITIGPVIGEAYTLVRYRLGSKPALLLLSTIRRSSFVQRLRLADDWEAAAEQLLERYADQTFSYVDALSFVAMRQLGIQDTLSFDRDFVVAGFTLIGDD